MKRTIHSVFKEIVDKYSDNKGRRGKGSRQKILKKFRREPSEKYAYSAR